MIKFLDLSGKDCSSDFKQYYSFAHLEDGRDELKLPMIVKQANPADQASMNEVLVRTFRHLRDEGDVRIYQEVEKPK